MSQKNPEILWTDGGEDSEKAFQILMEAGVNFREFRTDVLDVTDNDGYKTPCLMTGFGTFDGLRSIEGFARAASVMYELQEGVSSGI